MEWSYDKFPNIWKNVFGEYKVIEDIHPWILVGRFVLKEIPKDQQDEFIKWVENNWDVLEEYVNYPENVINKWKELNDTK